MPFSIRDLKLSYTIYNFFHKRKLAHNIPLFKKYHLRKKYYSSLSSSDFKDLPNQNSRKVDLEKVRKTIFFQEQTIENQNSIVNYAQNGYCIIKNFITSDQVDAINTDIENLQKMGTLKFKYGNKLMFAIHQSSMIQSIGLNKKLQELLDTLMDGKTKLFQSINFMKGSEQKTHSDSIHMTTFPLGGLMGVWVALEDVDKDNGALHYFPKSHLLPYFMNEDYENEGSRWLLGKKGYGEYEKMLSDKINQLHLKKEVFTCKKGDMLIWHANILHGGEPHLDDNRTRKSMVLHYFDEEAICYHEITQRPALFNY